MNESTRDDLSRKHDSGVETTERIDRCSHQSVGVGSGVQVAVSGAGDDPRTHRLEPGDEFGVGFTHNEVETSLSEPFGQVRPHVVARVADEGDGPSGHRADSR